MSSLKSNTSIAVALVAVLFAVATGAAASSGSGGVSRSATAAAAKPKLGRSVLVVALSGKVLVKQPRSGGFTAVIGRRLVPVGSTIDTSNGSSDLVTARDSRGHQQHGQFDGGSFLVKQQRSGTVDLYLTGGRSRRAVCGSHFSASASRSLGAGVVRRLHARVHGHYTTHGGNAAATAHGTDWTIEDRCAGTMISDHSGHVATSTPKAPLSTQLSPGDSIEYRCGTASSGGYCVSLLGTHGVFPVNGRNVRAPLYQATLLSRTSSTRYDLCVTGPSQSGCQSYPLSSRNGAGFRRSDVVCFPDQGAGDYQFSWRILSKFLGDGVLTYHAPSGLPAGLAARCVWQPPGAKLPADLIDTASSAHFVIHYNNSATDPNYISDQDAQGVLQTSENAFTYETGTFGMPTYVNDGDGKVDIYATASNRYLSDVFDTPPAGQDQLPGAGNPTAAYILLSQTFDPETVAWSVWQVLLEGQGRRFNVEPDALIQSTGEWAGANFVQGDSQQIRDEYPTLSQPLDCDASCPHGAVSRHWRFYQHLAEIYGPTIVRDVLATDAQLDRAAPNAPHMDQALQQVLAAHGSSLANELGQYAVENLLNSWKETWMQALGTAHLFDSESYDSRSMPASGGPVPAYQVTVKHLASHVLFLNIPADTTDPCTGDTLTLTITYQPGGSVPGVGEDAKSNGTFGETAPNTTTVQDIFNSCNGASVSPIFTNGTTNNDNMTFNVSGNLAVGTGPAPQVKRSTRGEVAARKIR